jgi:aryl-alcohol dehydrogenase-like predicted oxidoreductase
MLEALRREGKILTYGPSLGPAIGWRDEGIYAAARRKAPVMQIIYNILEQDPAREFLFAAEHAARGDEYGAVREAMRGGTNKKLCEPTPYFDPTFRAWRTPALAAGGSQFLIRVPHSSGMLEDRYTARRRSTRATTARSVRVSGCSRVCKRSSICGRSARVAA